jgi:predicted O-linked N-acetylglucosamine transferase (SPINDLY family)
MAPLYSEKLLLMPHSYFPSSIAWRHRRSHTLPPQPTSAEVQNLRLSLKLPSPPIMSAFNQLWKIDADLWSCICRVLLRVPNASLWLQEFPEAARSNLLKSAVSMGLTASRFHWTPLYAEEQHFLVKSLSNVQLDTLSYNGHTSLADVLWAGVPSVTLPMEKQSARVGELRSFVLPSALHARMISKFPLIFAVGASLLRGLGPMHTVARNLRDYEDLVVALLQTQRDSVRALVEDVRAARHESVLWNAGAWVKGIETLALRSYEVRSLGGSMHVIASATI